jgi:hypothetical protein
MAVGVDKTVHIHKSEVFRLIEIRAAGGNSLCDDSIDVRAAFAAEG